MLEAISARDIAVSGLKAQRTRMNVIANNIANAQTTRTPNGGGPFRRQVAILHGNALDTPVDPDKYGVEVKRVTRDPSPLRTVYNPSHPDANAEGYVAYPNVDVAMEMVNLVVAHRAYDANLAVVSADKQMSESALQIIQG
jgi:flagellar basal-body rod protein FlgC